MTWDVIVIGAGAAGLFAAQRSAQRGRRTLLLEKNKKLGVKILMSGGTRCNITHHTDARGIVTAFRQNGPFLHSALAALGPERVVDLMHEWGVPTKVESTGKVFPVSDCALDVRDALVNAAQRAGATIHAGTAVESIQRGESGFLVGTSSELFQTESLIITVGGKSYPGCGTTGDGYAWLRHWGHTIIAPRPALTPILTADTWLHELSGLTIPDVELSLFLRGSDETLLDRRRGSFLFTHFGISGPVALDISGTITAQTTQDALALRANYLPALPPQSFREAWASHARTDGKKKVVAELGNWLPKALARALTIRAEIGADLPLAELSRNKFEAMVRLVYQSPMTIQGTKGFDKAEVTAGGVDLAEVDGRTMQSKRVPHLFLAGEILNLDGPIGGYNFQAAFSTGWLAGDNA